MKRIFFLAPVSADAGLTTVSLGLLHALDRRGFRTGFFKPIAQDGGGGPERSTHFVRATSALRPAEPLPLPQAEKLMSGGRADELMAPATATWPPKLQIGSAGRSASCIC